NPQRVDGVAEGVGPRLLAARVARLRGDAAVDAVVLIPSTALEPALRGSRREGHVLQHRSERLCFLSARDVDEPWLCIRVETVDALDECAPLVDDRPGTWVKGLDGAEVQ